MRARLVVAAVALALGWGMARWVGVAVVGVVIAAWYVVHCMWFPLAACLWCGGKGKHGSGSGRSWRRCGRCRGTGERVRFGRRVWDAIRQRRDAGRSR